MNDLSIFLKKVAKSFVNRNVNVVPLQCQKGRRKPTPSHSVLSRGFLLRSFGVIDIQSIP